MRRSHGSRCLVADALPPIVSERGMSLFDHIEQWLERTPFLDMVREHWLPRRWSDYPCADSRACVIV